MPTVRPYRGNLAQICRPDMAIPPHGKLTADSIKAATGQFDLESIFKLAMSHMSIRVIENLALCPNLTVRPAPTSRRQQDPQALTPAAAAARGELDLSHNSISKMEGLEGLKQLKKLSLGNNEIASIDGLERLTSLETLQLQASAAAAPLLVSRPEPTPIRPRPTPHRRPRYAEFVQNAPRRATSSRAWPMHKSL